jgi:multimeric flavodoxin WrbA
MKLKKLFEKYSLAEIFGGDEENFQKLRDTLDELEQLKKVLLLTTSNRFDDDIPKSSLLAILVDEYLGKKKSSLIDVSKLSIYPCTGNVSRADGNSCGIKKAALQDSQKNPSGNIRCWVSYDHPDDDLWKVANAIFEADAVIFFTSIRWGQTNSYYQKLIERLTWLENRHTTLEHDNLLQGKSSGFICIGQNWNTQEVVNTQKKVHEFFGFDINDKLYWSWQYTADVLDETKESYLDSHKQFKKDLKIFIV